MRANLPPFDPITAIVGNQQRLLIVTTDVIQFVMERKQNDGDGAATLEAILEGLNPAQRHAAAYGIDQEKGRPPPLLMLAGAGTGKTKTLAHRGARLILSGVDPHRVLLLTFTRRAALEMTRRAQQILAASPIYA
jgi:DNA helicase-2/ATP-dependent DNA helicase PcrA